MGTRSLTMVKLDGQTKIAQYGQWDGYPDGQGCTVVEFLNSCDTELFKQKLRKCRFFNEQDVKERQEALTRLGCADGWMTTEQAVLYRKDFPLDSRDHGAEILQLVYDSELDEIPLKDSSDFIKDGLFCEWAYIVDLDKGVLQVRNGAEKDFPIFNEKGEFVLLSASEFVAAFDSDNDED